jgi:hypothetical protein
MADMEVFLMKWYIWLLFIWIVPLWTIIAVYFKLMGFVLLNVVKCFVYAMQKLLAFFRKTCDFITKKYSEWRQSH